MKFAAFFIAVHIVAVIYCFLTGLYYFGLFFIILTIIRTSIALKRLKENHEQADTALGDKPQ